MRLEDGLVRLSTEEKEKFALMCALLGRGTREVELSVQNLEEALVARYGAARSGCAQERAEALVVRAGARQRTSARRAS